jgi:hypothetical protein
MYLTKPNITMHEITKHKIHKYVITKKEKRRGISTSDVRLGPKRGAGHGRPKSQTPFWKNTGQYQINNSRPCRDVQPRTDARHTTVYRSL